MSTTIRTIKTVLLSVFVFATIVFFNGQPNTEAYPPNSALYLTQTIPVVAQVKTVESIGITVSDMDQAIDFYSQVLSFRKISDGDLLGLKLAGESENYGTEQEDLNNDNVSGARLHISDLRALDGPSIEFLEYLNPRDGRDFPMNTRSDDLFHWQTTLIVDDAETVAQRIRANGYIFVSSGVIEIPQQTLGFKKGFLVKDPDGHVVRIVEK